MNYSIFIYWYEDDKQIVQTNSVFWSISQEYTLEINADLWIKWQHYTEMVVIWFCGCMCPRGKPPHKYTYTPSSGECDEKWSKYWNTLHYRRQCSALSVSAELPGVLHHAATERPGPIWSWFSLVYCRAVPIQIAVLDVCLHKLFWKASPRVFRVDYGGEVGEPTVVE